MGANTASSLVIEHTRLFEHTKFQVADLNAVLTALRAARSTGRLTINFSQGVPGGTVEFVRETKTDERAF